MKPQYRNNWFDHFHNWMPGGMYPIVHVKLFQRGERCSIPEGYEYLMVISEGFDSRNDWQTVAAINMPTLSELKQALLHIIAHADGIVIQASSKFDTLANDLGLAILTKEWGCL